VNIKQILEGSPRSVLRTLQPGHAGRGPTLGGQYIQHVPKQQRVTPDGRPVIAIFTDSWSPDERHGAPIVNGGIELCERYGIIGIFPFPHPRQFGLNRAWNTPLGAVRYRKGYDDVDCMNALLDELENEFGSAQFCMLGFADAGMFNVICDGRLPGRILGVVTVNAPYDPKIHFRPGSRLLAIFGDANPLLRYEGGVAPSLRAKLQCWLLGGKRAWQSRPDLAAEACAKANGITTPGRTRTEGDAVITAYGENDAIVNIVVVNGAHKWYGRRTGKGMGSKFSTWNATTGSPEPNYSVNDEAGRFFGWDKLVPMA